MAEIYKSITYLVLALLLSLLGHYIESSFISEFAKDFISLLTTLLAINIASSTLIAGKLNEINSRTGQNFSKTSKELKRSLNIQLILIGVAFIALLLSNSQLLEVKLGKNALTISRNTLTVGIFIYYLDTLKDIGQALFSLLNFNEEEK
ncbi:MAG: hypothetical protein CMC96_03705 [Flavobacteriales bacterium]|nr:hypothetical protein [Flavobacteriales bacterium]|tara:strand:- start:10241 stop:10687 length:447 start_codon:yes stop_codon:yes gene_type:complete